MTLQVIPSIDLFKGQVVRLRRGEAEEKTVYSDDPVGVAMDWEAQGATRIHVVDLDGAFTGAQDNAAAIGGMLQRIAIPLQVAGGIRSLETAEEWLARGADRVVIGTKALTDEVFLARAVERFDGALIVAPDVREGQVSVEGWTRSTGEAVIDSARRLAHAGVPRLLVTDAGRDGMLEGPNVDLLREIGSVTGVPVIASGGVSSIDDLRTLDGMPQIEGAIVGKALYDGAFQLGDAIKAVA